uniref:Putative ovule protein n=1 Tax=Solanum chacoense TaxID=4108 RepID=A0A0V0IVK1_SOLCH
MTLLRSREVTPAASKAKVSSKTLENHVLEPVTPSKSLETSVQPLCVVTPTSPSLASGDIPPVARRRSLRLASKNGLSDVGEILNNEGKSKDFEIDNGDTGNSLKSDVGVESADLDEGDQDLGVLYSEAVDEIGMNESDDVGNLVCSEGRIECVKEGKGDKNTSMEVQGEGNTKFLSLRSGKKISKRAIEECSDGAVGDAGSVNQNDCDEKLSHGKLSEGMSNSCGSDGSSNKLQTSSVEPSSVKRRRFSREEKSKGIVSEQGLPVVHSVNLESEVAFGMSIENTVPQSACLPETIDLSVQGDGLAATLQNRDSKTRRISREEKGKQVMAGDDLCHGVDTLEGKSKHGAEKLVDEIVSRAINLTSQDGEQVADADGSATATRRVHRERFRDIARRNASRFAHFSSQAEQETDVTDEAAEEFPQEVAETEEIEDWPGPFSTAMKIIRDREMNIKHQQQSKSEKSKIEVVWVPKTDQQCQSRKLVVPSLHDLCMDILVKNADAITSLDGLPDALRHKICQSLCDSREMTYQFFQLLISGSPTEIRIRDCSWLNEENFTQSFKGCDTNNFESFKGCDTNNLVVLQLDQCGRCMPDYILLVTLARRPNNLPALTTLSLKGACRLSDVGLEAIISAAPNLRSMNLSQCSLLTCDGISCLSNSLGSVLRELYLDNCEAIHPMLILPALLKLEHLEVLSVAGIQTVCDAFIKEFVTNRGQSLREIILKGCMELTDRSLKDISQNCPRLRAIDLSDLCKLTDSAIEHLATGCREVDNLKLCRNPFSDEAVAAYVETSGGSLKELSLNRVKKVSHNTAMSLVKCSKNLISLDLSWCRNLTNEALGLIVDSCLSLEVLKLFGCSQVTSIFLDGHSNPQVKIIGLKMTPILQHIEAPDSLQQGPLRYSAVPWHSDR